MGSGSQYAALLRDSAGAVCGTTYGGTACWFPKRPSRFAAVDGEGDDATIIRCGWCPGCRQLDCQRLAQRLVDHFKEYAGEIWIVVVRAGDGTRPFVRPSLLRRRGLRCERGFFLLGDDSAAYLVRGERPTIPRALAASYEVQVHRLYRSRGRRAFSMVVAGLLLHRDDYGPWRKRFYLRGLPPLARDRDWRFVGAGRTGLHANRVPGARAARAGVTVHLPEAIPITRLRRRKGPQRRRAVGSLGVDSIVASVFQRVVGRSALRFTLTAPTRGARRSVSLLNSESGSAVAGIDAGQEGAAAEPRPNVRSKRHIHSYELAGYQGSLQLGGLDFGAWAERMAAKARARRPDET